jgi:Flp pilus assembly protein TadG
MSRRVCAKMIRLRRHWQGHLEGEKGTALIEFALVLPLLLLVLFGILDFGRALNYWNDQTHLASEAARYAAVNAGPQPLEQSIQNQAESGTAQVLICFPPNPSSSPPSTRQQFDPVHVTVRDTFRWLKLHVNLFGVDYNLADTNLTSDSEMRLEQVPTHTYTGIWNQQTNHCDAP